MRATFSPSNPVSEAHSLHRYSSMICQHSTPSLVDQPRSVPKGHAAAHLFQQNVQLFRSARIQINDKPSVYWTVKFGYFLCSHGTNTRPSAMVLTGKSISGSFWKGLGETRWDARRRRTRCWNFLIIHVKPFARTLTSSSSKPGRWLTTFGSPSRIWTILMFGRPPA